MTDAQVWDFDNYPWVDEYDQRMSRLARLCYDETLRLLPEVVEARPGDLVLDLGTGTGNSALPFLQLGCRVIGLDPSWRMLRQAAMKVPAWQGRLAVALAADPFLSPPLRRGAFDVVVSAYAIHHLDDPAKRRAVQTMRALLRAGGRLAIADTMFRDEAHKAQALGEYADLEDEYQPLLATFPAMVSSEGFAVSLRQVGDLVWVLGARAPDPLCPA